MRRVLLITILFVIMFSSINFASAQGMMGFPSSSLDNATIQSQQQEEQEGKNLLDDLSNKIIICSQISDSDFEKIGEYFMGQSIGDTSRHIVMNNMMESMIGEQGEEQAHTMMGKRMSGCDTSAAIPPMMQMMMGGGNMRSGGMMGSYPANYAYNNYGYWNIFWILLFATVIFLIVWIVYRLGIRNPASETPPNILKKRFAKGEITKKEFDDIKKEIGD